jgi:hypothetical protein
MVYLCALCGDEGFYATGVNPLEVILPQVR